MLKRTVLSMTIAGLCATHPGTALANDDSRWATTVWVGPLFAGHDTAQFAAVGGLADLGTLDPSFAADSATTTIDGLSFRDMFRTGATLGGELTYRMSPSFEPFARLGFSRLGGKRLPIGTISSEAFASPAPVSVNFDQAQSTALSLGARYFFLNSGALHPFVSGYVGADHLDALHADVAVAALARRFDRATVLSNNTRFVAGVQGGVSYDLSPGADIRFSIGAERLSAEELESKFLEPLGIDAIRVSERRWSVPAEIGINYRF